MSQVIYRRSQYHFHSDCHFLFLSDGQPEMRKIVIMSATIKKERKYFHTAHLLNRLTQLTGITEQK